MHWLTAISTAAAALPIGFVVVQWRIHVRDNRDREFARYVFDHTRSTDAVEGYTKLVAERRARSLGRNDSQTPPAP